MNPKHGLRLPAPARRRFVWTACLLLGVAGQFVALHAQKTDLPYSSGSTGADGPLTFPTSATARGNHALVFDAQRERVVLFGGNGNFGDTWEWDGKNWEEKSPITSPVGRHDHRLAYDAVRQRVILFGGYSVLTRVNDTWEWDGTNWTHKMPAASPSARSNPAMVYDAARQRVILFGGERSDSSFLNDTWEWDGTNWTQKTPATAPEARSEAAMAYDASRQRVVLFGGRTTSFLSDTWEWDGENWTQKTPAVTPPRRGDPAMAYDTLRQKVVIFGGAGESGNNNFLNDTWEWDGTTWTQKVAANSPSVRWKQAIVYDAKRQRTVLFGGANQDRYLNDTWEWDGTNWAVKAGPYLEFDMSSRPNGVWNFTSITVPAEHTVHFKKNAANTPVVWLATENVTIAGTVDVAGEPGTNLVGKGGPGGFDGGVGATRFDISGVYAGLPGQGPGGGVPGTTSGAGGQAGTYRTTYGNAYLQPLIGGSGGGGGASTYIGNGASGGGGGGAILIASSKDITLTGRINARGGGSYVTGGSFGGAGSGGAVRLVADRVLGLGQIDVDRTGRIRLEGFYRELPINSLTPSGAAPTETFAIAAQGQLLVSKVAGQPVAQPPTGSLLSPDVVFAQAGQITVTVTSTNIPDGTPVTLRIATRMATGSGIINLPAAGAPAVTLNGGTAQFTATVPAGLGSIQASAQYTAP